MIAYTQVKIKALICKNCQADTWYTSRHCQAEVSSRHSHKQTQTEALLKYLGCWLQQSLCDILICGWHFWNTTLHCQYLCSSKPIVFPCNILRGALSLSSLMFQIPKPQSQTTKLSNKIVKSCQSWLHLLLAQLCAGCWCGTHYDWLPERPACYQVLWVLWQLCQAWHGALSVWNWSYQL